MAGRKAEAEEQLRREFAVLGWLNKIARATAAGEPVAELYAELRVAERFRGQQARLRRLEKELA